MRSPLPAVFSLHQYRNALTPNSIFDLIAIIDASLHLEELIQIWGLLPVRCTYAALGVPKPLNVCNRDRGVPVILAAIFTTWDGKIIRLTLSKPLQERNRLGRGKGGSLTQQRFTFGTSFPGQGKSSYIPVPQESSLNP